jgi:hypothetical protein
MITHCLSSVSIAHFVTTGASDLKLCTYVPLGQLTDQISETWFPCWLLFPPTHVGMLPITWSCLAYILLFQALLELQLSPAGCSVSLVETPEEVAKVIFRHTKAVAEAPFK